VSFVGLAHAARGSAAALLPSFALVLTLAVVGVGSVVRTTVLSGEQRGSWAAVGADDVVSAADSGHGFTQAAQHAAAALPGVARSAAATALFEGEFTLTTTGPGQIPSDTVVLIVDPAQYSALTAGTPAAQLPAGLTTESKAYSPIPVIVSTQVAAQIPGVRPTLAIPGTSSPTDIVATVSSTAALPGSSDFVIVPRWALQRAGATVQPPNILLLDGSVDGTALKKTLASTAPGATVECRAAALDALTSAPFQSGTFTLLDLAMAAAAALAAGALLAGLALGAAAREQAAARLATMGLSRAQTDRLTLLEHLPSIAGALLGGAVCTVAIGALIGPGIDLSVFTGTTQPVPLRVDPVTLTAAGAAIAVLAALALTGHALLTHRRGVTAALRIGEQ
jgi:putative ABC transport system permease protein